MKYSAYNWRIICVFAKTLFMSLEEQKKESYLPQTDLSTIIQVIRELAWKKTKLPKWSTTRQ